MFLWSVGALREALTIPTALFAPEACPARAARRGSRQLAWIRVNARPPKPFRNGMGYLESFCNKGLYQGV